MTNAHTGTDKNAHTCLASQVPSSFVWSGQIGSTVLAERGDRLTPHTARCRQLTVIDALTSERREAWFHMR